MFEAGNWLAGRFDVQVYGDLGHVGSIFRDPSYALKDRSYAYNCSCIGLKMEEFLDYFFFGVIQQSVRDWETDCKNYDSIWES